MFQYEYEKRPPSAHSDTRSSSSEWRVNHIARRPLPPRPDLTPARNNDNSVPLKVWVIASASCFAVCAALVLATVVITKWGTTTYPAGEMYAELPEPIYTSPHSQSKQIKDTTTETPRNDELNEDIQFPLLEKLFMKNIVARDRRLEIKKADSLESKPQLHPLHDATLRHPDKKIEKKDQALYPGHLDLALSQTDLDNIDVKVPEFKPTLPDVFSNSDIKLADGYIAGLRKHDDIYEDYYNDDNLYDDYMQSNSMTSYLIEKVQELHDWITTDPDFDANKSKKPSNDFGLLLKALNESLIEGNVTIVMDQLKDIYFGQNYTAQNHSRKIILSNSTDLLSFGILTLDVMLLHNIQLMAWESQEAARIKMMKDPDVFAFNALFLEPAKVEAKQNEAHHHHDSQFGKRQNRIEDFDFGKNLLENVLEIGMSTARAAIHLGRAYKNTKIILSQLSSSRDTVTANIQNQISRNMEDNSHALRHLQSSYNKTDTHFTELDCVWLLYCRNLVATAKLNPPYGTMARINGMALRMLTGELPADKALETMLYEVLTGWTDLQCGHLFPRCSQVNAASIVLDSILQPLRKTQATNRVN